MGISYSAVLIRYTYIVLFVICSAVVSADARPAAKPAIFKEQDQKPGKTKKPDIKEVPKSRKQTKPALVKPKVKPVKIVRPKIKKR